MYGIYESINSKLVSVRKNIRMLVGWFSFFLNEIKYMIIVFFIILKSINSLKMIGMKYFIKFLKFRYVLMLSLFFF